MRAHVLGGGGAEERFLFIASIAVFGVDWRRIYR